VRCANLDDRAACTGAIAIGMAKAHRSREPCRAHRRPCLGQIGRGPAL